MKAALFLCVIHCIVQSSTAQIQPGLLKDTVKKVKSNVLLKTTNPIIRAKPVDVEIDSLLNKLMDKYITHPNTTDTWRQIKMEANGMLFQYYQSGKLLGSKPAEAYFIKMGAETMTANDIANRKMKLIAGVAVRKPAEFIILIVEKQGK